MDKITINDQDYATDREAVTGEEIPIVCKGCNSTLGILLVSTKKLANNIKRKQFGCPCGDCSFIIKSETESFLLIDDKLEYDSFSLQRDGFIAIAKLRKKENG